jgi:hypothetical protein
MSAQVERVSDRVQQASCRTQCRLDLSEQKDCSVGPVESKGTCSISTFYILTWFCQTQPQPAGADSASPAGLELEASVAESVRPVSAQRQELTLQQTLSQ